LPETTHTSNRKHVTYAIKYKKSCKQWEINIFIAFIFNSPGLSDSRAMKWTEAHFMGMSKDGDDGRIMILCIITYKG
jgi:hypothetical protein